MAVVDYLSTLNSGGSGLNITQLVDSIVAAEIEPVKELINKNVGVNDLAISEVAKFRVKAAILEGALSVAGETGVFQVKSSSTAVSMEVSDANALSVGNTSIKINRLASRQVLEFSGFASVDATVGAGTLTVEAGSWSADDIFSANSSVTAQTVTVASGGVSIKDFAIKMNALSGITAQIVNKGDGTFSLSLMSEFGEKNSLRITASAGGPTTFDTTDGSNEIAAAQDAEILINGITVLREKNTITDLVSGATLTLNAVSASNVDLSVATDTAGATGELQALVDQINTMRSYLKEASARGLNGADGGALAGDALIASIGRELGSITTSPLTGFGAEPFYLTDLGVKTNLDGTLSIDTLKLESVLIKSPEKLNAIYNSSNSMQLDNLQVSFGSSAKPLTGVQGFLYDAASDSATINGQALSSRTNANGDREFYKLNGNFNGMIINAGTLSVADGNLASDVYIGRSLVNKLSDYLETITSVRGDITTKETYLKARAADYKDKLTEADDKAEIIEARELIKFAKMEQAVTKLKSTGDYITTIMKAWAKSD